MLYPPFYDPNKSYEENLKEGPFGVFASGEIFENESEPKYDFLGQKVYLPFGIPAGPLINQKFTEAAFNKGFDICIYKTVRSSFYPAHPWPNVLSVKVTGDLNLEKREEKLLADQNYTEPLSITNSFGVPSAGAEIWQKEISTLVKNCRPGQVVVGSFQGTKNKEENAEAYIQDFKNCALLMKETGVKIMEVNFSCPNEGTKELLCFDSERAFLVAQAIREVIGEIPLIIKLAYFQEEKELKNLIQKLAPLAQAFSAINTLSAEVVNGQGEKALPGVGRERSGICGTGIKWAGLEMVRKLKKIREELKLNYAIIGVGGVMTSKDFKEYREAGADAVMSATGAMWNPYLAKEIKDTLN